MACLIKTSMRRRLLCIKIFAFICLYAFELDAVIHSETLDTIGVDPLRLEYLKDIDTLIYDNDFLAVAEESKIYRSFNFNDPDDSRSVAYEDAMHLNISELNSFDAEDWGESTTIDCDIGAFSSDQAGFIEIRLYVRDADLQRHQIYLAHYISSADEDDSTSDAIERIETTVMVENPTSEDIMVVSTTDVKSQLQGVSNPLLIESSQLRALQNRAFSQLELALYNLNKANASPIPHRRLLNPHEFNILTVEQGNWGFPANLFILSLISGMFGEESAEDAEYEGRSLSGSNLQYFNQNAVAVELEVELKNATLRSFELPILGEVLASDLKLWDTYDPKEIAAAYAVGTWSTETSVLQTCDSGLLPPEATTQYLEIKQEDCLDQFGYVTITINPGTSHRHSYEYVIDPEEEDHLSQQVIDAKLGDHISFEIAVPLSESASFDASNRFHYPVISGFPYSWMAFFSGNVLFQCDPNMVPGGYRPWLGYDAKPNGTCIRKYHDGFKLKYNNWYVQNYEQFGYIKFSWTAKVTRRMNSTMPQDYEAVYEWPIFNGSGVRINKLEGLNIKLLEAWDASNSETAVDLHYAVYDGEKFIVPLDFGQQLLLYDSNTVLTDVISDSSSTSGNGTNGSLSDAPINKVLEAYKKNRCRYIDNKAYADVYGFAHSELNYEIQDYGTNSGNRYGNGFSARASGQIDLELPSVLTGKIMKLRVKIKADAPLDQDKGYYGNIKGMLHVANWQEGATFSITDLYKNQADNYAVSFVYEDPLGRRRYYDYFSEFIPETKKNIIKEEGTWKLRLPAVLGEGYYSISLFHKNSKYDHSWTRIAGKEINDLCLNTALSPIKVGYHDIFNHTYSERELPFKEDRIWPTTVEYSKYKGENLSKLLRNNEFSELIYDVDEGLFKKNHLRSHVFNKNDTVTFKMSDNYPYVFKDSGIDLGEISIEKAKIPSQFQLEINSMHGYGISHDIYKYKSGNVLELRERLTGNEFIYKFNEKGDYLIVTSYNSVPQVRHKVRVIELVTPSELNALRAEGRHEFYRSINFPICDLKFRQLYTIEHQLLVAYNVNLGAIEDWVVVSRENISSAYKYLDGYHLPSYKYEPDLYNNYSDAYAWWIGSYTPFEPFTQKLQEYMPEGLIGFIDGFDALKVKDWSGTSMTPIIPKMHVRRYNSHPIMDMWPQGVEFSDSNDLNGNAYNRINDWFSDDGNHLMPWQKAVVEIKHKMEEYPYQILSTRFNTLSYEINNDLLYVYNMFKFYDNDNGAFSGNPFALPHDEMSCPSELRESGYKPYIAADNTQHLVRFSEDLAAGRKIIVNKSLNQLYLYQYNHYDNGPLLIRSYSIESDK